MLFPLGKQILETDNFGLIVKSAASSKKKKKKKKKKSTNTSWSRSGRPVDQTKFLQLKQLVRRLLDRAHKKYLQYILGLSNEADDHAGEAPPKVKTKKLYSLLKHSKQDSNGIASLKTDGNTSLQNRTRRMP